MNTFTNVDGYQYYQGNPAIKAAYQKMEYTPEQIQEYARCAREPKYFINNYMKVLHVDRGEIGLKLYDFQERMVDTFHNNRFTICKLPRQSGKSTTSIGYMLHYILFNNAKTVGILANKAELAQELLGRLQLAYERLPFWLQQGVIVYNKRSIHLENDSKIIATSSSSNAARGMSFSLLFLDEFAFVEPHEAEDFFRAVYPTISSGKETKMIVVSTPKGMNHFYRMWIESTEGRSLFKPIEIEWSDVPGRDEEWKRQQIANTSEEQWNQEFECAFIGSGDTLISARKLQQMTYVTPIKTHENVNYYDYPVEDREYIISVDTARGLRLDYSAFTVVDATHVPYKVVAVYRSNTVTPLIYPAMIVNIARYYNNAWVLIETNDVGQQVVDELHNGHEYEYLLRTTNAGRNGFQLGDGAASRPGVKTSTSVKNVGCANLKSLLENDKLIVEDYETFVEITTFVRDGQTFAAEEGCHDDIVMCLVLFAWIAASEYYKEMFGTNARKNIYAEHLDKIEADVMPIGFMPQDQMDQIIIDEAGTIWTIDEVYTDSSFDKEFPQKELEYYPKPNLF